jgi:hypothetical protein
VPEKSLLFLLRFFEKVDKNSSHCLGRGEHPPSTMRSPQSA